MKFLYTWKNNKQMININMSSKKKKISQKKLRILVKNHDYKHIQIVTNKEKIYSYLKKK